jgi:hypothetical protein
MAGLVPAIHVFLADRFKDVGARDKPGHDELSLLPQPVHCDSAIRGNSKQEMP